MDQKYTEKFSCADHCTLWEQSKSDKESRIGCCFYKHLDFLRFKAKRLPSQQPFQIPMIPDYWAMNRMFWTLDNLSNSDDSDESDLVDIGHAGTSMRFLTAYYSNLENQEKTLTGSPRMQERPIGILVDALRQLGSGY